MSNRQLGCREPIPFSVVVPQLHLLFVEVLSKGDACDDVLHWMIKPVTFVFAISYGPCACQAPVTEHHEPGSEMLADQVL